jgi:hypothetical protein
MELVLLCRWLKFLDPMADCSPQSLLSDASCFGCYTVGDQQMVRLQLLCEILQAGGGSGSSCIVCGDANPVADPNCDCAYGYNRLTGAEFVWDDPNGIWRPVGGGP